MTSPRKLLPFLIVKVLSTERFEQQVALFGGDTALGDHAQDGFTLPFGIDRGGWSGWCSLRSAVLLRLG